MRLKTNPPATEPIHANAAEPRRSARRSRLAVEITVALCVKLLLLFALYQIWFAHPQSKHMTGRGVETALFGPITSASPQPERLDDSGP